MGCLRNVKSAEQKSLAFADGVLEMACAYAAGPDGAFSDNEIQANFWPTSSRPPLRRGFVL